MQINTGDKVRFLNDTGGGTVVKIIDSRTVMVLEDDFEIPCLKENLIVVESQNKQNTATQQQIREKKSKVIPQKTTQSILADENGAVYLAFSPKENSGDLGNSPMELYLVNNTEKILLYGFYEQKGENVEGRNAGSVNPNSKIMLNEYAVNEWNELSFCFLQILFYGAGKTEIKNVLERKIKVQSSKFHKQGSYKKSPHFTQSVILHQLTGEILDEKLEELSQKNIKNIVRTKEYEENTKTRKPPQKRTTKRSIFEVDLHINELLDSTAGLSNFEILQFQVQKFHEVMKSFQNDKGKKIVFIHGVGNGTLKQCLYAELKKNYKTHDWQDASFKEYGWGATMVKIR